MPIGLPMAKLAASFSLLALGGLLWNQRLRGLNARLGKSLRDIRSLQESLQENHQFLSELIENSGTLIYVKDLEGRYQLVNKKWEAVTGRARAEVLGQGDTLIFPGGSGLDFRRQDLEVLRLGQVVEEEEVLREPGGLVDRIRAARLRPTSHARRRPNPAAKAMRYPLNSLKMENP